MGTQDINKLSTCLESRNLKLICENEHFTIINARNLSNNQIEEIINQISFEAWFPKLDLRTCEDSVGLHLAPVRLKRRDENRWTRKKTAHQLMYDLQMGMGVNFAGKRCIDIGCRSGENTLAMHMYGADVTGIDPDDSKFAKAEHSGLQELRKITLQDYVKLNNEKFDIATVFLYNIPHSERDSFLKALKDVVLPDGQVIISYADKAYEDERFSEIVEKVLLEGLEKFTFSGSLNRYILLWKNTRKA